MNNDEVYMQRCIQLAGNGLGYTKSNPLVGCVITKGDSITGEGYHVAYGEPHAEVMAWTNAGRPGSLEGCTVYVNLEPCCHTGKTPPCTELLTRLKPDKVIIAQTDPNPEVSGKGIDQLRKAGIEVVNGVCENEARFLNRRFNTFHEQQRPYIILKWAQTEDGFLAPAHQPKGQRMIISNAYMHTMVHAWRAQEMSILAGKGTIENDDPELTVRLVEGENPTRIVLDKNLEIDRTYKVFNKNGNVLVINCVKEGREDHIEYVKPDTENFATAALRALYDRKIISVFVEGGPTLFNLLLQHGLWDEMRTIIAPGKLQQGLVAPPVSGTLVSSDIYDGDRLEIRMRSL